MKITVNNVSCQAIIGGKDFLLPIDLLTELRKYLRVHPEGYARVPSYQKKQWDGYRYFITKEGVFATGFLELVWKYALELGAEVEVFDQRGDLPKINAELDTFIGNDQLRDYQITLVQAVDHYLEIGGTRLYWPRGILDAATNAGKTYTIAGLHNNVPGARTIFMLSKKEAYDQMLEYFRSVFPKVGEIRSGKYAPAEFTVAMVKTLSNLMEKKAVNVLTDMAKFNILVVDETHEAGATDYSYVLQRIPAGMRVFVSGTPLDSHNKVHNLITVGLSGQVLARITNQEMIDAGVSLKPLVKIKYCHTPDRRPALPYEMEQEQWVEQSATRAALIGDIVEEHSDKYIMLAYTKKHHGQYLYDYLVRRFPQLQNEMAVIHGTSPNRKAAVALFKAKKLSILISSMILKQSINIPNIQVLIMAQGGKSTITVKQLVGRAVRDDGESDTVLIFDFYDEGEYIGLHSRKRIKIYRKEGFDIEFDYLCNVAGFPKKIKA